MFQFICCSERLCRVNGSYLLQYNGTAISCYIPILHLNSIRSCVYVCAGSRWVLISSPSHPICCSGPVDVCHVLHPTGQHHANMALLLLRWCLFPPDAPWPGAWTSAVGVPTGGSTTGGSVGGGVAGGASMAAMLLAPSLGEREHGRHPPAEASGVREVGERSRLEREGTKSRGGWHLAVGSAETPTSLSLSRKKPHFPAKPVPHL